jgi:hypothetical protein
MSKPAKQGVRPTRTDIIESLRKASALLAATYKPMLELAEHTDVATLMEVADDFVVEAIEALIVERARAS